MTEKATDRQTDYLVDGEPNIAIQACIIGYVDFDHQSKKCPKSKLVTCIPM